jgi:hypothetical protein
MRTSLLRVGIVVGLGIASWGCSGEGEEPQASPVEDVASCQGAFVCSSSHGGGGNEYYLSAEGDRCAFYTSTGMRYQLLEKSGRTAEGASWSPTERGFYIYYGHDIATHCVGKSKYIPGEELDPIKRNAPEEKKDCRKDGHFCGTGMVCCSFRCNLFTNTCF